MLRKYSELGTTHRIDRCVEFPGTYYIYVNGKYVNGNGEESFPEFHDAYIAARKHWENNDTDRVSICWECSADDPRIGEVWFTPFYSLGEFHGILGWKES